MKDTMTLLEALEKERWHICPPGSKMTSKEAGKITLALHQPVIEISYRYSPDTRAMPLIFHHYIGLNSGVVLWANLLIKSRPIMPGALFADYENFIWCVGRRVRKHFPDADETKILDGIRAERERARKKFIKDDTESSEATVSVDLV